MKKQQPKMKATHRSTSSKPLTVHDFARTGDVIGLQNLLLADHSLLNARSPSMDQTPLHASACSDRIEVIKFLFEWQGEAKVELEAKNALGETPLHMAAKHGRNEAARLLLAHGASTEAQDTHGRTPLHLAVWHSIGSTDVSPVRTLLEYKADCSAMDNDGKTPMDYALEVGASGKLRELLQWHLEEVARTTAEASKAKMEDHKEVSGTITEASKAKMEDLEEVPGTFAGASKAKIKDLEEVTGTTAGASKAKMEELEEVAGTFAEASKAKMEELEAELSSIVGLEEVKVQLRKWAKGMILDEKRKASGLKVGVRKLPHMAFLGNPGTGKTMVARILGRLLHLVGVLPTNRVTEVQRTDLVGEFVGHTGPKTRNKIKEAEGGILFVDEAYRLIPMQKADDKDYGIEALEEIMSVMDSGKVVVIFAGYSEPMKRVIASNEGFCRRVTKFFHFDNFTCHDLAKIVHMRMRNQGEESVLYGFKLHSECSVEAIGDLIKRETSEEKRKGINGGLAEVMLVNARENLDYRLDVECRDVEELCTIRLEDFEAGLKLL